MRDTTISFRRIRNIAKEIVVVVCFSVVPLDGIMVDVHVVDYGQPV